MVLDNRRKSILNNWLILAMMLSLFSIKGNTGAQAQDNLGFIRKVRVMEPGKTGLSSPAGLAFSSRHNSFLVTEAGAASPTTPFTRLTPFGHRAGSVGIAASLQDPVNLAYDSTLQRLLLLQSPIQLFELREDAQGNLSSSSLVRYDIRSIGLQDPKGLAFDPDSGDLFILEAGPRILQVKPASGGSFQEAQVTSINLVNSGLSNLRGLAFDPSTGHFHVLSPSDQSLYELDAAGNILATRSLTAFGVGTPQAILFAPTTDQTDDLDNYSLFLADSGPVASYAKSSSLETNVYLQDIGQIVELSLQASTAPGTANFTSSLVRTTNMAVAPFSPVSPDPSGLTFLPNSNTLLMTDGEVNETVDSITHFDGANVWEMSLSGGVIRTTNISKISPRVVPMTNEPTGIAWNPNTGHYFVTDDDAQLVYDWNPGLDRNYGTADDTWTSFSTKAAGNGDPEGAAYDSWNDRIFIADGVNSEIFQYTTTGTLVSHFDVSVFGVVDPESVEFNTYSGTLFVLSNQNSPIIVETTTNGVLLQTIDVTAAAAIVPAGLAYAPRSDGSGTKSFYIVDRGIDNNSDPNIVDGKMYEITAPSPITVSNTAPLVNAGPDKSITLPDSVTLNGSAQDDGVPNPPGALTTTWSQISGPGIVTFINPHALGTTASFSSPGSYLLRLTGSDGELSNSDDIVITVLGAGGAFAIEARVSASSDDAEESATGGMSLTSTDLQLVYNNSNQTVGLRFTALAIPKGASITNAYIQFEVDEVQTETTNLIIQGEATDNPSTFMSTRLNISSRPRTAASVTWAPPGWTTVNQAGPNQRTPNLSSVIQEIVNRPGWSSGNSAVIIITGTGHRTAKSFDGQPAGAPLLHIDYLPASPTPTPTPTPLPFTPTSLPPTLTPTRTPAPLPTASSTTLPTGTPTPLTTETPTSLPSAVTSILYLPVVLSR